MSQIAVAPTAWDDASSPASARLARQFEEAWRAAPKGRKPSPRRYLPEKSVNQPGALLALIRAEVGLKWDAGEASDPETYRQLYPELTEDDFVAIVYEDFCLREEIQGSASVDAYLIRFQDVGSRLRRIFDIHALVGSGGVGVGVGSTTAHGSMGGSSATSKPAFPQALQTIAGFHLVEELGRGSFARVFLAKERNLADRSVALKVSRTGSREPQTLAKLQHTHIVPVHSYQTDELTSLHLLCMPYFGRVTLAHLLADPQSKLACDGRDLLAILDRLDPDASPHAGPSTGRAAIASRSHARAIAWWGARMAEALQHAHDRGVLHRDVKPSNVLITSDGLPMLLDFNLASELTIEETSKLGGTLDYMAPEHLEALADGVDSGVEARSDLYSLGVLLFEALAGRRPFEPPTGAISMAEALHLAAESRREIRIRLRDTNFEVPTGFEAVLARCLASDPCDRYQTAAALAEDLQAVADDMPLKVARERLPDRVVGWSRRHRKQIMVAVPIAAALMLALISANNLDSDRRQQRTHKAEEARDSLRSALIDQEQNRPERALPEFLRAERDSQSNPELIAEWRQAKTGRAKAEQTLKIREAADAVFRQLNALRFGLLDGDGNRRESLNQLDRLLKPFYVVKNDNWTTRPDLNLLDSTRWPRLRDEVEQLQFLRLVGGKDDRQTLEAQTQAIDICMKAERWSPNPAPWRLLKAWFSGEVQELPKNLVYADVIRAETSTTTSLQWGLLLWGKQHPKSAIDWLRHACELQSENPFYHFVLGVICDSDGQLDEAIIHFRLASALDPDSLYARYNYARIQAEKMPQWWSAEDDLTKVIEASPDPSLVRAARQVRGLVSQKLGYAAAARVDYDKVIASGSDDRTGQSAILNRAKLDDDAGFPTKALQAYDLILEKRPGDREAVLGRAILGLRRGQYAQAERDLTSYLILSETAQSKAEAYAQRAVARLALGRPAEALEDANRASRLASSPNHERILLRCSLAAGVVEPGRLADPEELMQLPWGAGLLRRDLEAEANRLEKLASGTTTTAIVACQSRAVILAVLRDPQALAEIDRAVALAPGSARARLIRARILRFRGLFEAAELTVAAGMILEPDHAELLVLRGRLRTQRGHAVEGLADVERAIRLGASATAQSARAEALMALGKFRPALMAWNDVIRHDPGQVESHLGRARCALKLGDFGTARSALTTALAMSGGRPGLVFQIGWLTPRTWRFNDRRVTELARQ